MQIFYLSLTLIAGLTHAIPAPMNEAAGAVFAPAQCLPSSCVALGPDAHSVAVEVADFGVDNARSSTGVEAGNAETISCSRQQDGGGGEKGT
ncbi:hypothetical protein OPT61_g7302 [Boeremia exigua]|uniref:Uncharacterized protein n=1 Tax=Boeremia exigua TaxID=749465 RepID=A0ACC2I429_9PLEO|nr:hypothetical protein OPT61_g7302 [Boeremia exigua]